MARLKAKKPSEARPSKPKILIFGRPGVGKTWGALDFPGVYYIDAEDGASRPHYMEKLTASGGVYLGPEDGACDFAEVLDQIRALATQEHPYRTLVIDSFSKLFNSRIAIDYERLEDAKYDMDKTFGREKKGAIGSSRKMLRWFNELDMNVILICHEKDAWKDGENTGVTFDGWEKLEYELDLCLHITKTGPSRKAKATKSRLEGFPENVAFPWSYEEFAARYGRDVMEAEAVAVPLATPEQVARYTELLGVVKLPEKVQEKWSENADSPAEMTGADLDKRIQYLEGQLALTTKKEA